MTTITKEIVIPADRKITLDLPPAFPAGRVKITVTVEPEALVVDAPPGFDPCLVGKVDMTLYGSGRTVGDIVAPLDVAWEANQ